MCPYRKMTHIRELVQAALELTTTTQVEGLQSRDGSQAINHTRVHHVQVGCEVHGGQVWEPRLQLTKARQPQLSQRRALVLAARKQNTRRVIHTTEHFEHTLVERVLQCGTIIEEIGVR